MNVYIDKKLTLPGKNSAFYSSVPKHQTVEGFSDGLIIPRSTTGVCSLSKCLENFDRKIMLPTGETSVIKSGCSQVKQENCGQGDSKNIDNVYDNITSQFSVTSSCDQSTSAVLVPVISTTSGRNILEEMKRKAALTLLNSQKVAFSINGSKSSLVPGTNVEYRTPGANHKNKNGRIKRPMNAFMVWARDYRGHLATSMPNATNSEISVKLGQIWAAMRADDKKKYYDTAEKIKAKHRKDYPDWVYQPNSPGMKKREEVFNYGRTPTPPPNNDYANRVPVTSTSSGTQQTTIVVLSNDNKIQHTKLTSSESLTLLKDGTSSRLINTSAIIGSQEKRGQDQMVQNNQTQFDPTYNISTKYTHGMTGPHAHAYRSHSDKEKSNVRTSVDPSLVQYQSAMEIHEKNKVSDKTKDLLASKIMSIRPVGANSYKSKPVTCQGKEECKQRACTSEQHVQATTNNITNVNTQCTQANVSSDSRNTYPMPKNYSSYIESLSKGEQNILKSKSTPIPKSDGNTHAQFTNVLLTNIGSVNNPGIRHSLNECQNFVPSKALSKGCNHNTLVENCNLYHVKQKMNEPMMLKPLNHVPFLFGANLRTPTVRPALARGMIQVANGNRVRCELQRMLIPQVPNIAKPHSIPMAESFISPTTTPNRLNVEQRDSSRLGNHAVNPTSSSISTTSTDSTSDSIDKPEVQEEKNTPSISIENQAEDEAATSEDNFKAAKDVMESYEQEIPSYFPSGNGVDEMFGSSVKQEDELWPFPFSDNPGDWNDDEKGKCMYVELIDPYDPFLDPEDMMSEMYPGSLTLDMNRWGDYMTTRPEVESESLEDFFHETAEEINISPVPLRETLRRLKNTKTEVSDMCDVISGDLITERSDEHLDLVQEDFPEILTDDLALKLSGIMGSFVVEVEDEINEVDSETLKQVADETKANQIDTGSVSIENSNTVESESIEKGRNDEVAYSQRVSEQDHPGEHTVDGGKLTPDDRNNRDTYCLSNSNDNAEISQRDGDQTNSYKTAIYKQTTTTIDDEDRSKTTSLKSSKSVSFPGKSVTDSVQNRKKSVHANAALRRSTRSMSHKKAK